MPSDTDRRTLNVDEVARLLGIGRRQAYAAAARGELPVPVIRVGRRLVVPAAAVERLLSGEGGGA